MNYELPKVVVLRALILLTFAITLLARDNFTHFSFADWLRRPLIKPILGLACVTFFSTLVSLNPLTSLLGGYHRQQGLYLALLLILWALLLAKQLRRRAARRCLSNALIGGGTLVALTPFLESLYWQENAFTWRPGGSLGNPIFLSAYLIMILPFTLARLLIATGRKRHQFVLIGALILQLLAVLITQSRGPWVGLLAGGILFMVLLLWPHHRRLMSGGIIGGLLLVLILLVGLQAEVVPLRDLAQLPYVNRLTRATDLSRGTTRVRIVLWETALKVVRTWPVLGLNSDRWQALRPLLGYGPDTAGYAYTAAYPPELARIEDPGAIWDRAHNEVLDILTMRGWLGVAAVAALNVAVARRGYRLWRASTSWEQRVWIAAPLSALLAHAVEVQFAFTLTVTAMLTWFCLGWLTALGNTPARRSAVPASAQIWRPVAGVTAGLLILVAVRMEGGALWADTLAGQARQLSGERRWEKSLSHYERALALMPWYAPYHQFRGETLFNLGRALPAEEQSLKGELFAAADRGLARARALNPLEVEYYSNAGILHATWAEFAPAHFEQAVLYYEQALQLAPRVRLLVELGHIYHKFQHYEKALAQYAAAVDLDPRHSPAYYGQGLAWQSLGERAKARAAFARAWELDSNCSACKEALNALEE